MVADIETSESAKVVRCAELLGDDLDDLYWEVEQIGGSVRIRLVIGENVIGQSNRRMLDLLHLRQEVIERARA